ncbi:MAG: extracellular solute-binding protein [Treponema sp.]|jgi:putative aldouronate transport system substrate-binding protein|nr:extracellular solute-binding protein [Treponema sp.]
MKKLLSIAVLLCIAGAAFGQKKQEPPTGAPNSPITISVYSVDVGRTQPAANNPVFQYLKEKLNVTFTWDILVGDKNQREGTMIAGGQYPDILNVNETKFIDAGALIPLEDLIEKYGPNIKAHYKDVWQKMKSPDGHIYHLIDYGIIHGQDQNPEYNGSAFWIQKAVLKDAGYPKVTTVDQYFDLLEAYYKKNPTINNQPTIPFVILTHDWRAFEMWNPPNFLAGYPNEGNGIVDPKSHKYTNFFTMDISKRWFKKLGELNQKGLIDRTSFTDNYDQYGAKISAGRVLGQFAQGWQFMYGFDAANKSRGQDIRTMVPLPIVWDEKTTPRYRNLPIPNIGRGMGISVSAKDPIRIIRFVNDLLAEDVQRTLQWGIEGQHWQKDAKGVPHRTAQQRTNWQNPTWQEQNRARLMEMFPKIEGSFSDGYPTDLSNFYPEREAMLSPEDKELFAAYNIKSYNELMDKNPPPNSLWFPTWNMPNPPDGSPAQIALQRQEQLRKQRLPQMILAAPADFEKLWADYLKASKDAGIATYEKYMQDQLNKRIKEWSAKR